MEKLCSILNMCGEVPEWLNGNVSKIFMLLYSIGGSNPPLSFT